MISMAIITPELGIIKLAKPSPKVKIEQ